MTTTTEESTRPPIWGAELCDRCGGSTRAKYVGWKSINDNTLILTLCSHHAGTHIEQMLFEDWEVEPID
jgi:hypothetical protein